MILREVTTILVAIIAFYCLDNMWNNFNKTTIEIAKIQKECRR